jgi:hypothetical protein
MKTVFNTILLCLINLLTKTVHASDHVISMELEIITAQLNALETERTYSSFWGDDDKHK